MVHQRTGPPPQAAGRFGYRGANQTTKCVNCGFGRGQFGVEFCDEYCSLDCYTSAKVTGRCLPRDGNGKNDGQATPWPRGLLVEAPPSPKPWRGRTWSNDTISWRATFTYNSNLSIDNSSSIESAADWPVGGAGAAGAAGAAGGGAGAGGAGAGGGSGGGDDQVGDGRGVGSGVRFGVAGEDGNANGNADANANAITNTVEKSSPAFISGGGAASSNGASGGRSVGDGGCNSGNSNSGAARIESGRCDEGVQDDGSRTQRRDGVDSRSGGGGGVGGGGRDNCGAGAGGGEADALLRRVLPPLAPVPRAGAIQQQHRRAQSGGRNVVDSRAVAFAPTPPQASTPNPHSENAAAAAAAGKMLPTLPPAGVQIQTDLSGITAGGVGVTPLGEVGEFGGGLGGTAAPRLGEPNLQGVGVEGDRGAASNGAAGTGAGNSAAAVGHEGGTADAAGQNAADVAQDAATGVDGAAAVEATVAVIGEDAEGSGDRVPSMDGLLVGTRCGATAGAGAGAVAGAGAGAEGEDVEVMKRMMSCAPTQTYSTRAAVRQWRHMFLP